MDDLVLNAYVAEGELAELPSRLVVVAADVDDVGTCGPCACSFARRRYAPGPVPPALEAPAVDDVSDQIEMLALVPAQKVEQELGLTAARAKMDVGQEDRPMPRRLMALVECHEEGTVCR